MDKSKIIVGLITGTRAYPQDDLSLDDKATIILFAHDILRREIENVATGVSFQPIEEFYSKRKGHSVVYECPRLADLVGTRVVTMFTTDSTYLFDKKKNSDLFMRHTVLLTGRGRLFWLRENCAIDYNSKLKPIPDAVREAFIAPVGRQELLDYLGRFPELFARLLTSFKSVVKHGIEVRDERQKRANIVLQKLDRMDQMITAINFVYD